MTRLIKKYPNRRLYDTSLSCYITLEEIRELVLKHIAFKVVDARTEEDVTNNVLLQIINQHENSKQPIFTTNLLLTMIRFYGNPLQQHLVTFLENSFSHFKQTHDDYLNNLSNTDPIKILNEITQHNLHFWETALADYVAKTKKPRS